MAAPTTTDTVVPMHYFDDNAINRSVVLYITLRFDTVLVPELLRNGLERLLQIGGWKKLGARLRATDKGKLEYHIPASFDDKKPGIRYSHVTHEMGIAEHPVASRIPRPTPRPSVHDGGLEFMDLARRPDGPRKLADYLNSDEPQISLHIVSFTDATLVSLSWSHTFIDAMAMSAIFNAWVSVLDGKEQDVPPVCNFDTDPLSTLGTAPKEPSVLATHQLSGLNMLSFGVRYMWDLFWHRDAQRTIYLPAPFIQSLKESALKDLQALQSQPQSPNSPTPPPSFVSEGDLLCAFLTRLATLDLPPTSETPIAIQSAFDLRASLTPTLLPPPAKGICLSNAVFITAAFTRARDVLGNPLAHTAAVVRNAIVAQRTPEQVDALAGLTRAAVAQSGRPPVFGEPGMRMVVFSNWTKAKFFELDFGAAVAGGAGAGGVRPSFVNLSGESSGLSPRGSWPILGKDSSGGYWVQGNLRTDFWERVETEIAGL